MIVPLWFTALWGAYGLIHLTVACLIVRNRMLRSWPSVFALCLNIYAFTVAGQLLPYRLYFWTFWINTGVRTALWVWVAWDVMRALPGCRFMPQAVWTAVWITAAAAGLQCGYITRPHSVRTTLDLILQLNRSVTFTWGAVLLCCICCVIAHGLGFSLTGVRILTGAILKLLSAMTTAMVIASHASQTSKATMNVGDTAIALGVALYWLFTINASPLAAAKIRDEWASSRHLLSRHSE